eukprot:9132085-Pyramimonas_sp.AAC.1
MRRDGSEPTVACLSVCCGGVGTLQAAVLRFAVPPAIALFPQYDCLPAAALEEHVQAASPDSDHFFFNKGL